MKYKNLKQAQKQALRKTDVLRSFYDYHWKKTDVVNMFYDYWWSNPIKIA